MRKIKKIEKIDWHENGVYPQESLRIHENPEGSALSFWGQEDKQDKKDKKIRKIEKMNSGKWGLPAKR